MWTEVIPFLCGAVLIGGGLWWRLSVRGREHRILAGALGEEDPVARCAAVRVAVEHGARRHAKLLLDHAESERDPQVRDTLMRALEASFIDPASSSELLRLQLWARRERWQRLPPDQAAGRHDPEIVDPGKAVIVTGVGGAAGIAVVRALTGRVRVIGTDCDPTAAGQGLADEFAVIPRADDPDLVPALVKVAQRTGATALLCTVAEEFGALHYGVDLLHEAGLATWLPPVVGTRICLDKWRFALLCERNGIPIPATGLATNTDVPGPWIVKPRFGRGSRDVHTADTEDELEWALSRVPEPIVQTRLTGREFTVDALTDRDSRLVGAVPRWRLETKAGISTKGRTFACPHVARESGRLLAALGHQGPANVQGFMADDGTIKFIEVNPRFSGGLPLSLAAGSDLVGEYLRGVYGLPVRQDRLRAQAGLTMYRYHAEVFVE
ncbi:ATP-grasp domain-containing protein [Amycolatopsis pigmentata]|uniref:ATP-grasp domain-containing protein n=1 Tax=Amycolatopsis pigmentata TaxID=450801 RepID=A0ABW5FLN4_9PSEU